MPICPRCGSIRGVSVAHTWYAASTAAASRSPRMQANGTSAPAGAPACPVLKGDMPHAFPSPSCRLPSTPQTPYTYYWPGRTPVRLGYARRKRYTRGHNRTTAYMTPQAPSPSAGQLSKVCLIARVCWDVLCIQSTSFRGRAGTKGGEQDGA
jgi:hypothetical protein